MNIGRARTEAGGKDVDGFIWWDVRHLTMCFYAYRVAVQGSIVLIKWEAFSCRMVCRTWIVRNGALGLTVTEIITMYVHWLIILDICWHNRCS